MNKVEKKTDITTTQTSLDHQRTKSQLTLLAQSFQTQSGSCSEPYVVAQATKKQKPLRELECQSVKIKIIISELLKTVWTI